MSVQQELEAAVRDLELIKVGLKNQGGDAVKRAQMESKMHWLENKVDKLRRKSQS